MYGGCRRGCDGRGLRWGDRGKKDRDIFECDVVVGGNTACKGRVEGLPTEEDSRGKVRSFGLLGLLDGAIELADNGAYGIARSFADLGAGVCVGLPT